MNKKNTAIAILAGLALAGLGYLVYSYLKGKSTTTVKNPANLTVPTGATTAAAIKAANPNATDTQVAALMTQLLKQQTAQQQAKGGSPPSFGGGGGGGSTGSTTGSGNGFVNGVRKNSDGSVDKDNGNGTYTETEKDGTKTTYTNNGIPVGDGDKIAFDSQGNAVVQHDNGNGTYTEVEKDGSTTVYVASTGQALGDGDTYVNGAVQHDNGNGTYTETDTNGSVTTYTNSGTAIPDGYSYDTKTGLAYDPSTDTYFDPNSGAYTDSSGNDVSSQVAQTDTSNLPTGGSGSDTTNYGDAIGKVATIDSFFNR